MGVQYNRIENVTLHKNAHLKQNECKWENLYSQKLFKTYFLKCTNTHQHYIISIINNIVFDNKHL